MLRIGLCTFSQILIFLPKQNLLALLFDIYIYIYQVDIGQLQTMHYKKRNNQEMKKYECSVRLYTTYAYANNLKKDF